MASGPVKLVLCPAAVGPRWALCSATARSGAFRAWI